MNTLVSQITRAFRHRDFRILWSGAFLSFIGSWVQTVGQGYLVYKITGDPAKLALVTFAGSLPVSILGPLPGTIVDMFDRKKLLVAEQLLMGCGALFLSAAVYFKVASDQLYWIILGTALIVGTVSAFEMPTRQSVIGRVVPQEDLSAAIPLNALTFNLARLLGPAIGGLVLRFADVDLCYLINGISYIALVFSALAIRADLRPTSRDPQPIQDLVLEGMRYTFQNRALRTLFILESIVSVFGIFYIPLIPAIAKDILNLDKAGLSACYVAMGVGSVCALLLITATAERGLRALVLRCDMTLMALALLGMSWVQSPVLAFVIFAVLGFCGVAHFNTTNTMFQLLSPDRLRGRVLSMHVWALAGLSPFGVMFFGWLARGVGLGTSIRIGAAFVMAGAIGAWMSKRGLEAV
ncbi:MAG: hypothetical protein QOJ65_1697 [Fimbriimonadaceae bacterium]|jgi:MFS family permease|nr:hypothetical protein [Fimbriimonadaceae bacterium]